MERRIAVLWGCLALGLQLGQLLLQLRIRKTAEGSNGRQAQSTPGQGADQEQLQQVAMAIDRAASLLAGPIDQALGGIEAHGARGDLLVQSPAGHVQQLIEPVEGAGAIGRSQRGQGGISHEPIVAQLQCKRW